MSAIQPCDTGRKLPAVPVTPDFSLALSVADTCRAIRAGKTFVYDLINEGRLKTVVIGRRRLVLRSSLDELLNPLKSSGQ